MNLYIESAPRQHWGAFCFLCDSLIFWLNLDFGSKLCIILFSMLPQERELLQKVATQVEENNRILRSLRSDARWAKFFGVVRWVIILGPIVWAYYVLSPHWALINDYMKASLRIMQSQIQMTQKMSDVPTLDGVDVKSLLQAVSGKLQTPQ